MKSVGGTVLNGAPCGEWLLTSSCHLQICMQRRGSVETTRAGKLKSCILSVPATTHGSQLAGTHAQTHKHASTKTNKHTHTHTEPHTQAHLRGCVRVIAALSPHPDILKSHTGVKKDITKFKISFQRLRRIHKVRSACQCSRQGADH